MKKNRSGNQRQVNNDSLFATRESVGEYWRAVSRGTKVYSQIRGKGAIHKKVTLPAVVFVKQEKVCE